MNADIVILTYYTCFMSIVAWLVYFYANKIAESLNDSDKNPVPQGMMDKYVEEEQHTVTSEEDEEKSSSEADSQEPQWGGEQAILTSDPFHEE